MKLSAVLMALFSQQIFAEEPYDDFTRIECSSSGKSCLNLYCYLSENDQLNNSISFGCDLQRKISPVYVSLKLSETAISLT